MVSLWAMHGRYILDCYVRRGLQLKLPACTRARGLRVNEARRRGARERRRTQRALRAHQQEVGINENGEECQNLPSESDMRSTAPHFWES
eukprot:6103066-Pyramimonas_sp.AAC.1